MQRADYTLVTRQNRNGTLLVGGFGGGADDEPLGGAGHAPEDATATGDAQSVVALAGESDGFLPFVGLGGGELGLAGFAVDGEVVQGL
jgi:hypothetical protein